MNRSILRTLPGSVPAWTLILVAGVVLATTPVVAADTTPDTPTTTASGRAPEGPPPGESIKDARHDKYQLEGVASWYGGKFQGRLTANGEVFDTNHLTAAHRELPFGTIVRVINTTNNRVVVVRINDRGPFVDDRVIDLSRAAADIIGLTATGIAPVRLEIIHYQEASTIRTIQVASFGDMANAEALVARLQEEELPASVETVPTAGVHRVVIPGIEKDTVPEVQRTLASIGYRNVLVRQE
ncbi:MAG: septal ring lytic transglycosylase RlpA family protein [Alkalispirochaeta sp.]